MVYQVAVLVSEDDKGRQCRSAYLTRDINFPATGDVHFIAGQDASFGYTVEWVWTLTRGRLRKKLTTMVNGEPENPTNLGLCRHLAFLDPTVPILHVPHL